ncbi:MAG: PD-(D/E)XK nuclease family protein [Treponema sp.]|nr:PD-(D/E)XK nuclease family protein [Treponema sp.]
MAKDILQASKVLLEQCSSTIRKFEENYKQTGEKYNIFKITNITTDERKICKVIEDLLNPEGSHYQGGLFLEYFIEMVNEKSLSPFDVIFDKALVKNEYHTDIGRIDIVISDGNIFIPIEVKINAGDQEKQVSRYTEYSRLRNKNRKIPVIYLTKEGNSPSNAKIGEYISISWKNDILSWLHECLKYTDDAKIKSVFEVLKQLIASIRSFCGISEDEKMEKEIQKLVTESDAKLKAAFEIKQALESIFDDYKKNSLVLFQTKILEQVKKEFLDAFCCYELDGKWDYMSIPIKNGRYSFGVTYDWKVIYLYCEIKGKKETKEVKALYEKMNDLFVPSDREWEGYVWGTDRFTYPRFTDVDPKLYYYELHKEYSENTMEVVNLIISFAKELDNV